MSGLIQEPLRDSIARGGGVVIFTIKGKFQKRYLDPKGFELDTKEVAKSVTREGDQILVKFGRPLVTGDKLWC